MWVLTDTRRRAGEIKCDGGVFMGSVRTLSCPVTRLKEGFCGRVVDEKAGFTGRGLPWRQRGASKRCGHAGSKEEAGAVYFLVVWQNGCKTLVKLR